VSNIEDKRSHKNFHPNVNKNEQTGHPDNVGIERCRRQPRRRLTFPHKLFIRFLLSHEKGAREGARITFTAKPCAAVFLAVLIFFDQIWSP